MGSVGSVGKGGSVGKPILGKEMIGSVATIPTSKVGRTGNVGRVGGCGIVGKPIPGNIITGSVATMPTSIVGTVGSVGSVGTAGKPGSGGSPISGNDRTGRSGKLQLLAMSYAHGVVAGVPTGGGRSAVPPNAQLRMESARIPA